jgi:hypothetical protein
MQETNSGNCTGGRGGGGGGGGKARRAFPTNAAASVFLTHFIIETAAFARSQPGLKRNRILWEFLGPRGGPKGPNS